MEFFLIKIYQFCHILVIFVNFVYIWSALHISEMESDSNDDVYRHNDDSADEYFYETDRSSSRSEEPDLDW